MIRRFNPGDIVTWADTEEGRRCRERYTAGPYVVKGYWNDHCITVVRIDGSPVYLRGPARSPDDTKSKRHIATSEDKFVLDVFLDAARKAQE